MNIRSAYVSKKIVAGEEYIKQNTLLETQMLTIRFYLIARKVNPEYAITLRDIVVKLNDKVTLIDLEGNQLYPAYFALSPAEEGINKAIEYYNEYSTGLTLATDKLEARGIHYEESIKDLVHNNIKAAGLVIEAIEKSNSYIRSELAKYDII
ncbi:hypothetical protein [Hymenobacter sp. GOD-10R]|uniref:hypothetical protein n=1 Tax=Hymenobacter sp. GOD-10R TaxID=3093922 RepID=UPI002D7909E4|nr:hypothetical protein [Hymenobacter sp. GOD-10R]WRQ28129.1 hypothetical protein SD425_23985 [Hymenobacter sp. GOD-10R]